MGLFGGGNSSSTTRTTTQDAGFSQVSGPALALQGTGNNIQFVDQGAIKAATTIATQALGNVEIAGQQASQTTSQAVAAVSQAAAGQTDTLITTGLKWAAIIAIAYFAFKAFGKSL